jgi:EAL domain-containing protein (putative c-di-GMP-specific phosphodiesterase class I)/CheY-like chemotaxis protein
MERGLDRPQVLIVDDEEGLREVYGEILDRAGYDVSGAGDGPAALELIRRRQFAVVLSDIVLPGMDGIQVLRAVRERDLDTPVLLMTANPGLDTAIEALELGAVKYLIKPVPERDLIAAVERAMRLHRIARLKREAFAHLRAESRLMGNRAGLESRFTRALGSLWVAYQPIVRAADGQLAAHEALVRTGEPAFPDPGALLAAAERLGRVSDVGRAVRARVASRFDALEDGQQVFVNLHAQDLSDECLYASGDALSLRARSVVLEITERAALDSVPDLRSRIAALRRIGYRIAVDDLGAGYAGLNSFAALEPDVAKLDLALVRDVDREPVKRHIVGSMTSLCKELGILVVAEGVETTRERDALVELGCDLLQGFLFGLPAAAGPASVGH